MTMKELVLGVKVSLGVVRSVARVIKDVSDLEKMRAGDILVIPKSDPVDRKSGSAGMPRP